jgi:hypothetical protein
MTPCQNRPRKYTQSDTGKGVEPQRPAHRPHRYLPDQTRATEGKLLRPPLTREVFTLALTSPLKHAKGTCELNGVGAVSPRSGGVELRRIRRIDLAGDSREGPQDGCSSTIDVQAGKLLSRWVTVLIGSSQERAASKKCRALRAQALAARFGGALVRIPRECRPPLSPGYRDSQHSQLLSCGLNN